MEKCRTSPSVCDAEDLSKQLDRDFDTDSDLRKFQEYYERFQTFAALAIVFPLLAAFGYFGFRWVVFGEIPKFKRVRPDSPKNEAVGSGIEPSSLPNHAKSSIWFRATSTAVFILAAVLASKYVGRTLGETVNEIERSSKWDFSGLDGQKTLNAEGGNRSALATNQTIRVLVASQDAEGVTQAQLNLVFLKNLEAHAVIRIKAILKENGVIAQPEITSEASYVESGPYKLAVIRLRSSDGSRAVFVNGIIGKELKRIACIRNSTEQIPVTLGPCGDKVKEVFGVGF